jgi:hypothetical protein
VSPNAQELDSRIAGSCDAGKSVVRCASADLEKGARARHPNARDHGCPAAATLWRCSMRPNRTIWASLEAAPRLLRWPDGKKGKTQPTYMIRHWAVASLSFRADPEPGWLGGEAQEPATHSETVRVRGGMSEERLEECSKAVFSISYVGFRSERQLTEVL